MRGAAACGDRRDEAAVDAESLADALKTTGDIDIALARYNDERQPYGAALVERGRHIGALILGSDAHRIETLLREYGAAGVVREQPIQARI